MELNVYQTVKNSGTDHGSGKLKDDNINLSKYTNTYPDKQKGNNNQ